MCFCLFVTFGNTVCQYYKYYLPFRSRKAILRCRNRDEKVDESVEKSYTYVDSIYVLENGCAAHQELEHFDKNENDYIYTYVE